MPLMIAVLIPFAALMAADADAETNTELLVEMFSPILILTEDTVSDWGEDGGIRILKPEPVEIMGAHSAENLRFWAVTKDELFGDQVYEIDSYLGWEPPVENQLKLEDSKVDFSQNKFAFFVNGLYVGNPPGSAPLTQQAVYAYFDYPGETSETWNAEYKKTGENFRNTAYVHIYKRKVSTYMDSVTVIQYKYFYPYNDWWNDHEGDWQGIDVVVSSSDPNTATILGVEYRFHGAWLNYYKDWGSNPGLTTNFVFNPRTEVKLSPGPTRDGVVQYTHPVVYVGAGSHGGYPIGGEIQVYHEPLGSGQEDDEVQGAVGGDYEYMTHTGLVLSTQAPASGSSLWERYDLQLLPEPDLADTNNMGLDPAMSWLGAQIQWGTPDVGGIGISESPGGPYNSNSDDWEVSKGWGELKFFEVGRTGFGPNFIKYSMHHRDLPYEAYHHWAILSDETWSGSVNLTGDVVVFPGARLTIEPGTVVTFPSNNDRHQFKKGNHSLSEIFVYGTLESKGTGSNFVSLGGGDVLNSSPDRWGGIQVLGSGSLDLGDWTFFSNINPTKPRLIGSSAGENWVLVRYDYGGAPFILKGKFTYETRLSADGGTTWSAWSSQSLLPGQTRYEGTAYEYREEGLREVTDYLLSVRAMSFSNPSELIGRTSDTLLVKVRTLGTEDLGAVVLEPTSPRVGQAVTATLTDEDGYIAGSVWTWEHRLVGGTTWTALTGSEDTAESSVYTPKATDLGKELRARVRYRDGHGPNTDMAASAVSAAVVGNQAPVITGPEAVPYAENATVDVGSYTASDPDGHNIQWLALAGSDANHFELTGTDTDATRTLRFKNAPDYETKNTYSVSLKVKDKPNEAMGTAEDPNASLTTTLEVMVTVSNADDPGAVALTPAEPRMGQPVTAHLTDPDGSITGASWTWEREGTTPDTWVVVWPTGAVGAASGAELSSYTPGVEDVDRRLRVGVRYRDGLSADANDFKTAETTSAAVVHVLGEPQTLTAKSNDGNVLLRWQAPVSDGGWAITHYEYRYSTDGGTTWQRDWTWIGHVLRQRVRELTNGTQHTFEVRAVNARGAGDAARVVATPRRLIPPRPTGLVAHPGDGHVQLTWDDPGVDYIDRWYYGVRQRSLSYDWQVVPQSDATTTTYTVEGLTNGREYYFRIRAHNDLSIGPPSAPAVATPLAPCRLTVSGSSAVSHAENDTRSVATYTATASNCGALTWTLGGTDVGAFRLDGTGTTRNLHFNSPPNFETRSSYAVEVVVSDETVADTVAVAVSITNVEEAGTVALSSSQPRVGTATTATLSDPDGIVGTPQWSWSYFSSGAAGATEEVVAADAVEGANGMSATNFTPAESSSGYDCKRGRCMTTGTAPTSKPPVSRPTRLLMCPGSCRI